MTQFLWKESPPWGVCLTCGTSSHPDGFVDFIADTNIKRDDYEISGTVDVILCADCVHMAGNMVGMASKKQFKEISFDLEEVQSSYGKALDDIDSWKQRYDNLIDMISLQGVNRDDSPDPGPGDSAVPIPQKPKPDGEAKSQGTRKKPSTNRTASR